MGNTSHKNGAITQAFEHIPVANLVVAGVHGAAGNEEEANRAYTKGTATAIAVGAGAAGGPVAGVATGAVLHGLIASKKNPDAPAFTKE